jgi:hypothetical protein
MNWVAELRVGGLKDELVAGLSCCLEKLGGGGGGGGGGG